MYIFLLTLIILVAAMLMVIILMQASKGGGLSGAFGAMSQSSMAVGTRQAANILHKATIWLVTIFMTLTVVLVIIESPSSDTPRSITQQRLNEESSGVLPDIPAIEPLQPGQLPTGAPVSTETPVSDAPVEGE
jgi:preprotein translocase subunit SecG